MKNQQALRASSTSKTGSTGNQRRAPRALRSKDTSLQRYFQFIGNHKALSATEEIDEARRLYELEQELWRVILSNFALARRLATRLGEGEKMRVKADEEVFANARSLLDGLSGTRKGRKRNGSSGKLIGELAEKLCDLDEDRTLIGAAMREVQRFNSDRKSSKAQERYKADVAAMAERVRRAKNHFIQENLGLVVNVAKRYHVEKMPLADLIQEGNLGLMRAVDKFDYKMGFRFSTYASWWIRSYISRAIVRKSNTVRIPEYMLRDRNRIKRTEEASRVKLGRAPNEKELAKELGLSEKRLKRTRKHDVAFIESLDREVPGSDSQRYIDFLADEDEKGPFENAEFSAWVRNIPKTLGNLSVTERFVICWRFGLLDGEEMTLQEIGKCLNLSRERIRQIQEEALVKLRTKLEVDAA
jgi:RNA polymerase primary sigma factor